MFERDLPRMDDEVMLLQAIEALLREGFDRRTIENALVRYAPIDLDLFADCLVKALASINRRNAISATAA
ncbi:hypothetical protein FP2506_07131 [Fulvimarina pelagi HTCC2506]|uniref:Uncharacterized protein n=1 Tax=Fulvimarina pelagi HTCC2506 TaxID=314231 RepID=Q0G6X0_9HYPH|nr:hypothetical protein [Fulvimarina pelagi]EAU42594.1 hypothetical protein FP2506_07131 [Fulvimarina pelagi HTCC2506]